MEGDTPKLLGHPAARELRLGLIREPHIAPLTEFVEALRAEAAPEVQIPYFDPWDGGIQARVLLLLEAPGPKAIKSGFVSRNNPDESARNTFEIAAEAGLARKDTVIWNVVPWYIGTGARIRAATAADVQAGLRPLPRLLQLLPLLRTVVLVGRKAERAKSEIERNRQGLLVLACPHPSPMYVNHAPGNRRKILHVLKAAADSLSIDA